jgi:hypothetical protein
MRANLSSRRTAACLMISQNSSELQMLWNETIISLLLVTSGTRLEYSCGMN